MHEIVAISVIHLSVLNIRSLQTVKIPLPHTAHDKKLAFSKTDRNYVFHEILVYAL